MRGTVAGPYAGFRDPMASQGPTILPQGPVSNVARSDLDSDVHETGDHEDQILLPREMDPPMFGCFP